MPFPNQEPRAFNAANIQAIKGNPNGVYGLFRANVWVYVGKGDIKTRLMSHLNNDNPRITKERPTHWVDEVTSNMDAREVALIAELGPVANRRLG